MKMIQEMAAYEAPELEVIEVMVEQGFAGSPTAEGPGDIEWED